MCTANKVSSELLLFICSLHTVETDQLTVALEKEKWTWEMQSLKGDGAVLYRVWGSSRCHVGAVISGIMLFERKPLLHNSIKPEKSVCYVLFSSWVFCVCFFIPCLSQPKCFQVIKLTLLCIISSLPLIKKKPDQLPLHNM